MTTHIQARGQAPGAIDRLFSLMAGLTRSFRRRKSVNVLEQLDDHLLKDIGLTRFDVREMRRLW